MRASDGPPSPLRGAGAAALAPRLLQLFHETWKYFLVSLAALAVDYGLLVGLTSGLHLHYLVSSAISYSTGAVAHYGLCIRFVFRSHRLADRRMEFVAFFLIGLLGLAVTQAVLWASVDIAHLAYTTGKLIAIGCSFTVNYVVRKLVLFTNGQPTPALRA